MNYLTEIRLFYEWLGTHPLPPSAIALWHGLMYIANCCGWEQEITIPLGLIQTRTMMTPSSIYRSRRILVECGLVTVSEQGIIGAEPLGISLPLRDSASRLRR